MDQSLGTQAADASGASQYGDTLAPIFDVHLARPGADACVAFLRQVAGEPPATCLELGVGTGRLALPLSAAGYEVTGVDASARMVEALRAKPGGDRLRVIVGDVATAALGDSYALVYAADCVLADVDGAGELPSCLRNVRAALAPDGAFVCDGFLPPRSELHRRALVVREALPGGGRLVHDWEHDPDECLLWGQTTVTAADGQVYSLPSRVRYRWPHQLDAVAREAGLALVDRYADWSRRPLDDASGTCVSVYRPA